MPARNRLLKWDQIDWHYIELGVRATFLIATIALAVFLAFVEL